MRDQYDDYFPEPIPFEEQIEALMDAIKESVSDDIKGKLDRLERENAELREIKANVDAIKREYNQKTVEMDMKLKTLATDFRQEKLSELFRDFEVILFQAESNYFLSEKCDKCDEQRRVHFISPLGKEMTEACNCSVRKVLYAPDAYTYQQLYRGEKDREFYAFYEKFRDDEDRFERKRILPEDIYTNGTDFSSLNIYSTYFRDIADCQAFCDWLTAKKAGEESCQRPAGHKR